MEFDVESVKEYKNIASIILIIGAIALLLWLAFPVVSPKSLTMLFEGNAKIEAGESATLIVELRNVYENDASNVQVTLTPESDAITIEGGQTHTESIIGRGSYRKLSFTVSTQEGVTEGSYKITGTASFGSGLQPEPSVSVVYLEVVSR